MNSKIGLYLRVIRDNERIAKAVGVDTMRYKLIALIISGALTAIAGAIWVQYYRFVEPQTFSPHLGIVVILMTVVGGIGTLWGPVVGAVILIPVGEVLRILFPGLPGLNFILYGVIVMVLLLTLRSGIIPWFTQRRRRRQQKTHHAI